MASPRLLMTSGLAGRRMLPPPSLLCVFVFVAVSYLCCIVLCGSCCLVPRVRTPRVLLFLINCTIGVPCTITEPKVGIPPSAKPPSSPREICFFRTRIS